MSDPETRTVLVHLRYPDDPPVEMVYRADGSVEQLSGRPGLVMEVPAPDPDAPTVMVTVEHSPDESTWTDLTPCGGRSGAALGSGL